MPTHPPQMDCVHIRQVVDAPPCLFQAVLEVSFVAIHEVSLVHQTNLDERLPAKEHERAADPIDLPDRVSPPVGGEAGVDKAPQTCRVQHFLPQGREVAVGSLERAVRVHQVPAHAGRLGVAVHEACDSVYRAWQDDRVAVEQEHVAPRSSTDADVVAGGDAGVAQTADQRDLGEVLLKPIGAAIVRCIVHDDDLVRHLRRRRENGPDAVSGHVERAVVHNDD